MGRENDVEEKKVSASSSEYCATLDKENAVARLLKALGIPSISLSFWKGYGTLKKRMFV